MINKSIPSKMVQSLSDAWINWTSDTGFWDEDGNWIVLDPDITINDTQDMKAIFKVVFDRDDLSKFHIVMGESFSGSVAGARFATHEDIAYIKRALSIISSFMPQGSSELPWS